MRIEPKPKRFEATSRSTVSLTIAILRQAFASYNKAVSQLGYAQRFLIFTKNFFQFCETMLFMRPFIHCAAFAKETDRGFEKPKNNRIRTAIRHAYINIKVIS